MCCYGFLQTLDSRLAVPVYHGPWELRRIPPVTVVARMMSELSFDPPGHRRILVGSTVDGAMSCSPSCRCRWIMPLDLLDQKVRERATCPGKGVTVWTRALHMRRRTMVMARMRRTNGWQVEAMRCGNNVLACRRGAASAVGVISAMRLQMRADSSPSEESGVGVGQGSRSS
jgi:hypothetical protein